MLQEKTGKRAAARDCKDHTCRAGPCSGDLAGRAASDSECRTWCTNSRVRHCFDSGGGSIARLYPVRAKDVEPSFDDEFELGQNDADRLIQISGGAVLWQKERLLNLAIKAVLSNVKNIAWFDCDTILQRPDWAEEANRQLDKLNVIQLFSDVVDVSPEQYEKQPALHNGHTSVMTASTNPSSQEGPSAEHTIGQNALTTPDLGREFCSQLRSPPPNRHSLICSSQVPDQLNFMN